MDVKCVVLFGFLFRVGCLMSVIAILGVGTLSVRAEVPEIKVTKLDSDRDGNDDTFSSNITHNGATRMMVYESVRRGHEEVAYFVNGQIVCLEKRKLEDVRPYEIITYSLLDPEVVTQMVTYDRERNAYVQADTATIAKHDEELKRLKSFFSETFRKMEKSE